MKIDLVAHPEGIKVWLDSGRKTQFGKRRFCWPVQSQRVRGADSSAVWNEAPASELFTHSYQGKTTFLLLAVNIRTHPSVGRGDVGVTSVSKVKYLRLPCGICGYGWHELLWFCF